MNDTERGYWARSYDLYHLKKEIQFRLGAAFMAPIVAIWPLTFALFPALMKLAGLDPDAHYSGAKEGLASGILILVLVFAFVTWVGLYFGFTIAWGNLLRGWPIRKSVDVFVCSRFPKEWFQAKSDGTPQNEPITLGVESFMERLLRVPDRKPIEPDGIEGILLGERVLIAGASFRRKLFIMLGMLGVLLGLFVLWIYTANQKRGTPADTGVIIAEAVMALMTFGPLLWLFARGARAPRIIVTDRRVLILPSALASSRLSESLSLDAVESITITVAAKDPTTGNVAVLLKDGRRYSVTQIRTAWVA
jgi:hypothetical protein